MNTCHRLVGSYRAFDVVKRLNLFRSHRMRLLLFTLIVCFIPATNVQATTWDEPWHEEVMRRSDSFVKVKVTENIGPRFKADVLQFLGGIKTPEQIELEGFSLLRVMSTSSHSHELRLPFQVGQTYYVFIKKSEKTNFYQIPTPTSGWARIDGANVPATYRHSYHQALVPPDVYEKTMQAIFKGIKGQPYDEGFMNRFIKEQLTPPVALLGNNDPAMMSRFFLQHVALESFYHLGKGADLSLLVPFVNSGNYHVEISACRAVSRINSKESKEVLMKFIEGKGSGFAKVMSVWGLQRLNAKEMIPRLEAFVKTGTDQETGFGGSIMDPRIATMFPDSVKESIKHLLNEWSKPSPNKT